MMAHMQTVHEHPLAATELATMCNPHALADAAEAHGYGVFALCSIIARGYWIQINGRWVPKQEIGL